MFTVPSFAPRPLEQLPYELDEVAVLVKQENELADEVRGVGPTCAAAAVSAAPLQLSGSCQLLL